ncbi:MAG: spore germination protein [Bacillota bacterium]
MKWQDIVKLFQYKPNMDREGFVLKELPAEKDKQKQATTENPSHEQSTEQDRGSRMKKPRHSAGVQVRQEKQEAGGQQHEEATPEVEEETNSSHKRHRRTSPKHRNRGGKPDREDRREKTLEGKESEENHLKGERPTLKKPLRVAEIEGRQDPKRVSPYLENNKKRIEEIYGLPENKDFIIREFTIAVAPPAKAFILFMEGMSDKAAINNFILQPMMLFSNFNECVDGYLLDHVQKRVLIGNQVTVHDSFEQIIGGVNYGSTAVFIEGCDKALLVETKGWNTRSVDRPVNEVVVRGSQEAFGETLRTNTALIRKHLRTSKLTTELLKIGTLTHSDVAVMYIRGIANKQLVDEVKRRVQSIKVDGIIDSGILEQYIEDSTWNVAPQVMATERPDRVAYMLLQGKVAILLDGNPYVLVVPSTMFDQLHTQEDYYLRPLYGSLLRIIRTFAFYISFLTPGLYLAIVLFHKEMIPTELLLAISGAREKVPFPSFVEVIIMEISFELIREAGLRVPSPIGSTIGIVGALILGQAAVQANIVSPILVIVVAVTGLASYAIPSYSMQFSLRIMRFFYIILGTTLGFVGIVFGLFVQMTMFSALKSFGVPFLAPMSPTTKTTGDVLLRKPVYSWEKRPDFLNSPGEDFQPNIARGWVQESTKREK